MKDTATATGKAAIPVTVKLPLHPNQYFQGIFPKKYIFLHHTAGGSAASSIGGWAANPARIATPYVIDRDGTIYECYDPKFWAYSLGVKGNSAIERASIPIEIASYGNLTLKNGKYIKWTGSEIEAVKVVKCPFRNFDYYENYTPAQIAALSVLIPYLMKRFGISLQADPVKFWDFKNPATLPPGIYSHSTVRKDKVDVYPHPDLVNLVYSL